MTWRLAELSRVLILARYDENVSWATAAPCADVVVLNRGAPLAPPPPRAARVREEMRAENVGRESYLYLDWVLRHYDALPERMTFCQADPNYRGVSGRVVLEHASCRARAVVAAGSAGSAAAAAPDAAPARGAECALCADDAARPRRARARMDAIVADNSSFSFIGPLEHDACQHDNAAKCARRAALFAAFFPACAFASLKFRPGGCFSVTRDAVRRQPPRWYRRWLEAGDLSAVNRPEAGYMLERAWACVFGERNTRYCPCSRESDAVS